MYMSWYVTPQAIKPHMLIQAIEMRMHIQSLTVTILFVDDGN